MIELKSWQFLCAFEQHKTLKNTAEALHITQPALSQVFRRLEQELGVSLFVRSRHNRIALNETGKTACRLAASLLEQAEALETALRHRELRIGLCTPVLAESVRKCVVSLDLEEQALIGCVDESARLLEDFEKGELDLIVTQKALIDPMLECRRWIDEQLYLAVSGVHPLASRKSLIADDLSGESVLLFGDIGFWKEMVQTRLSKTHFVRIDDVRTFEQAASLAAFPFFVTRLSASIPSSVRVIPMEGPDMTARYSVVCRKEDHKARRFLDSLCQLEPEGSFFRFQFQAE